MAGIGAWLEHSCGEHHSMVHSFLLMIGE